MIDSNELYLIGVRGFPQLFSELKEVFTVARLEGVPIDSQIFLRCACGGKCARSSHETKRHPQCAAPHGVGGEAVLFSIPCVSERARSLQRFALDNVLIATRHVNRLRNSVWPFDSKHVGLEMRAQTEMRHTTCCNACLKNLSGAKLEL